MTTSAKSADNKKQKREHESKTMRNADPEDRKLT